MDVIIIYSGTYLRQSFQYQRDLSRFLLHPQRQYCRDLELQGEKRDPLVPCKGT